MIYQSGQCGCKHVSVLIVVGILSLLYSGVPFIEDDITFTQAESFNPLNPQFNLTCNSTSGPATVVTWLRDGNIVVYDTNHVLTQTVGTFIMYSNVLTVTGREPGNYLCNITNVRGHDTSTFIVEGIIKIMDMIIVWLHAYRGM